MVEFPVGEKTPYQNTNREVKSLQASINSIRKDVRKREQSLRDSIDKMYGKDYFIVKELTDNFRPKNNGRK